MPTHFLHIIDILGTIAFAVSGAFLAMEKKLDPFGVLVLAFVTAAVVTMLFGRYLKKFTTTLFLFDALGLGLFTLVGIKLGIEKDFSVGICITLGTITACFGGVVRDVLLNNIPLLFRKEIYAMACIAGGAVYFLLREMNIDPDLSTILGILIIFVIRIIAVRYKLFLPQFYTSTIQK